MQLFIKGRVTSGTRGEGGEVRYAARRDAMRASTVRRILAAKRGLEIAEGQPRLVEVGSWVKPSTVALYEIAAGKVQYKKPK